MTNLSAQITALFYVAGVRLQERSEKGQTTAEYVGILAFVALLTVIVIGFRTEIGEQVKGIITSAFGKISETLG